MIKNGKPYTNENGYIDDKLLADKSEEEVVLIMNWIRKNIIPRKTFNLTASSYRLKHYLERDTGLYLTNNEFKDAMLICGYTPYYENELNWHYRISQKSPCLQYRRY